MNGRPRYEAYDGKAKEESAKLVDCDLLRISPTNTYHLFLCNIYLSWQWKLSVESTYNRIHSLRLD